MTMLIILSVIGFQQVIVQRGEVLLPAKGVWRQDFAFAPGDTIAADVSFARKGSSSWGCLAAPFASSEKEVIDEISLSNWQGPTIEQYYGKSNSKMIHFTADGGPFTLILRNNSNHRQKYVNLAISRVPASSAYVNFSTAFRADSLYDTTWTIETRQRLVRTETIRETTWTVKNESRLVRIDTTTQEVVNVTKHIPAGSLDRVYFDVPAGTSNWTYWIGVEEAYSFLKDAMKAGLKLAGALAADPVLAVALGAADGFVNVDASTNIDIRYDLDAYKLGNWSTVIPGGRVKGEGRLMQPDWLSNKYCVRLDNTYSVMTPKNVRVHAVAVQRKEVRESYQIQLPQVKVLNNPIYESYEERVPVVKMRVIPSKSW
jgi:hypothetical protein